MTTTITIVAGSSAATIQAAINAAPAGATIRLAAGTYTFDRTVVIDRDDLTVTGAGAGATIITTAPGMGGDPAFRIGNPLFTETESRPVSMEAAAQGARVITVGSGQQFQPGDTIWIETPNTDALFDQIGDDAWRGEQPLRTALVTVTAVNGNQITLDRGLPFALGGPGTQVSEVDLSTNITLRDLTLRGSAGTANPGDFTNASPATEGGIMLLVNTSNNVTVSGIDIIQPGSNGMVIARSIDASVSDLTVIGAQNKGPGGNGYGLWIRDVYDSEFTGLTIYDTRHAVLFASVTSAAGNRVQVDATNRDINFHGGLDQDNFVLVDRSIRSGVEQGYLGSVSFVNPGTDYGAPTDPDANTILFRQVVGTVRADDVRGADGGARLSTLGGNDTLQGGTGNDRLDGGTGNDLIRYSRGYDTAIGGAGTDTVDFDLWRSEVSFVISNGQLVVRGAFGATRLIDVEFVLLENGRYAVADLISQTMLARRSGPPVSERPDALVTRPAEEDATLPAMQEPDLSAQAQPPAPDLAPSGPVLAFCDGFDLL